MIQTSPEAKDGRQIAKSAFLLLDKIKKKREQTSARKEASNI
jgi:hypothetical protein